MSHRTNLYWHALVLCVLTTAAVAAKPAFNIRMSDELVLAVLNVAKHAPRSYRGLAVADGDIAQLNVYSNRQVLAFRNAEAAVKGREFTAPPELRDDTVSILCGDNLRAELFGCVRVRLRVLGKIVKPLAYRASNEPRLTAGMKWRARGVAAIYSAEHLDNGFTVEYDSVDDASLTRQVTADEASRELLLTVRPSLR